MRRVVILALLGALTQPIGVVRADPAPFPEFTFKRQKPPKAGVRKRITVQIEPKPFVEPVVVAKPEVITPEVSPIGAYDWFWQEVSPDITANASTRLRLAFDSLHNAPGGVSASSPRLQAVQAIARAEGKNI